MFKRCRASASNFRCQLIVKMRKLINNLKDVYVEFVKKTTWPTWQKLQGSALLVMVATVVLALMLFIIDFAFQHLMTLIYSL